MKKLIFILFAIITFNGISQELDELYLRNRIILQDSIVTHMMQDTLTNKLWVRDYVTTSIGSISQNEIAVDSIRAKNDSIYLKSPLTTDSTIVYKNKTLENFVGDSLLSYTTLDSLSNYLLSTQIRSEISDSLGRFGDTTWVKTAISDSLSNYATQSALEDTASAIRGDFAFPDYGTDWQIPVMKTSDDNFVYTDRFKYDTVNNSFTAGYRTGSIGLNSIAMGGASGTENTASGQFSKVWGNSTTASNTYSTAFGVSSTASGLSSTAFGSGSTASGLYSTAFGSATTASGSRSTAIGSSITAYDYLELVTGQFNVVGTGNQTMWINTDNLFTIGNGIDNSNRANAFQIKKNGTTYINDSTLIVTADTIFHKTHLKGDSTLEISCSAIVINKLYAHAYLPEDSTPTTSTTTADVYNFVKGNFINDITRNTNFDVDTLQVDRPQIDSIYVRISYTVAVSANKNSSIKFGFADNGSAWAGSTKGVTLSIGETKSVTHKFNKWVQDNDDIKFVVKSSATTTDITITETDLELEELYTSKNYNK